MSWTLGSLAISPIIIKAMNRYQVDGQFRVLKFLVHFVSLFGLCHCSRTLIILIFMDCLWLRSALCQPFGGFRVVALLLLGAFGYLTLLVLVMSEKAAPEIWTSDNGWNTLGPFRLVHATGEAPQGQKDELLGCTAPSHIPRNPHTMGSVSALGQVRT